MRIALDVTSACDRQATGIARYVVALQGHLFPLANQHGHDMQSMCRLSRWRKRRYFPARCGLFLDAGAPPWPWKKYDVFHSTGVRLPRWKRAQLVATVHDVFHLSEEAKDWSSPAFRERMRDFYRDTAERAQRMIAVSAATRQDWIDRVGFPADRIDVIHLGVDTSFAPRPVDQLRTQLDTLGIPAEYALFVGSWAVRKNIPRMIRAFAKSQAGSALALVIAGPPSDDEVAVRLAIAAVPSVRIILLDFPADEDLRHLYAGAQVLLFATLYEGFGLPILEAMMSGCPVVTANTGAAPEVAGGHAVLADPRQEEDIADAIDRALRLTPVQRTAARQHASTFTWQRCAEQTLLTYAKSVQ